MKEVVREVLLDQIPLVATTDDEVAHSVDGVRFHDVPENGLAADLNQGFRAKMALFADSGAQAAG
jgi:hypothetical protein